VLLVKATFAEKYFRRVSPELPLSLLDGLSIFHESRLAEEDIENVPNMATADIVQLMVGTRFAPNRIIDWVDQAILYTALGPEGKSSARAKLRSHGIRTASGVIAAYEGARPKRQGVDAGDRDAGSGEVNKALAILDDQGRSPLRTLVDTLKTNPNLQLVTAWRGKRVARPFVARLHIATAAQSAPPCRPCSW
jgi:hypothetical protein